MGGDVFFALNKAHPEYEVTALVRTPQIGAKVALQYPKIRLVYGTLEDSSILEEEASKAKVVIRKLTIV